MTTTSIRRSPLGLDWRWAPGASRALRRATNEDNFELPTYSAPERRAGAKKLQPTFGYPLYSTVNVLVCVFVLKAKSRRHIAMQGLILA